MCRKMKKKVKFDSTILLKIVKLIRMKIRKMMPNLQVPKNWQLSMRSVVKVHACVCIVLGLYATFAPHSLAYDAAQSSDYNHMAHEFVRLYGCITTSIGWFVWTSKGITDGRIVRAITEVFAIAYMLQALVMLRAQFTNPRGHSCIHWLIALVFTAIGAGYLFVRLGGRIKDYSLPYGDEHED